MQKPDTLLRTKLRLPSARPILVPRPRLQEQIVQGLRGPLTLLVAPAGFGKTTLVTSCLPNCGMPVAWLSLDKNDNEAGRFPRYLVAALQEVNNALGIEARQFLAGIQQVPNEAVLTSLINDLDALSADLALVLDDYQFINSHAVHEQVAFLLEHCPKTFHLVIATRSDPPLPLARLRARGQTVELRTADLSFTEPEATTFLNEIMGLHLDSGSVAALKDRTEGWVAGLQMAALSMRDRQDVARFIEAFSGTNRYILDYLLEEVLAGQTPEVQHFLLCTSILDRLSAPLCDAVLASEEEPRIPREEPPNRSGLFFPKGSASILEYLEKANLFLIPLDDERVWYRYHHLFGDLLRAQLQKSVGVQAAARYHLLAAAWHEANGSILEAIHHASIASDDEQVERLIEQNYVELLNRGEMSALRYWTGKLSKELVNSRPRLCLYEAQSHSWFGELDEADSLLEAAEKRIPREPASPEAASLLGQLTYVKSRVTAMRGDLPRAIAFNLEAREFLPATNPALQMDMGITLGYLYFLNGDYSHASQYLEEVIRSGRAVGAILNPVAAYCVLARLYACQGRLNQSYELYQQAARWIQEVGGQHLGASSLIEVGMADVLCEWNDLNAALRHVKQGLAWIHLWGKADDLVLASVTAARIYLAQSNIDAAAESVENAIRVIRTHGIFAEASRAAELAQVKLWLAQGDFQTASRWAASVDQRFAGSDPFRFEDEVTHIVQARVWIAENKTEAGLYLLSHLDEAARLAQRMGRVTEILLLQALACQKKGNDKQAIVMLTKCLAMAEPEGYRRLFLDEGEPMRVLLARWLAQADAGPVRDCAVRLLSAFDAEPHSAVAPEKASPGVNLVEPLSPRELEVLHLMAIGCTNQAIAQQLVVAPGTVKTHTASIYRKLEVANRTEAVSRARELGLLP